MRVRMDYKRVFDDAMSRKLSEYTFSDNSEIMKNIMERAKNMKNEEAITQKQLKEITVEHIEPKKSTKILHAVAGVAGAAAVLTGGFFGLKWLNENGGLKERIPENTGAGYSETSASQQPASSEIAAASEPDNSEKAYYEAKIKELNDTKDHLQKELEGYESAKKATALLIADLTDEKDRLTEELTRLRSLGEDTSAVEANIKIVEEKIGQQEIMLDSFGSQVEQTNDKLGAVKIEIAKLEAEMKGYKFYEFGDYIGEFIFDGYRINVKSYEFDGKTLNIYYDVVFDEENEISASDKYKAVSVHVPLDVNSTGEGGGCVLSETDDTLSWVETVVVEEYTESFSLQFVASSFSKPTFTVTKNSDKVNPAVGENAPALTADPANTTEISESSAPTMNGIYSFSGKKSYAFKDYDLIVDHFNFDGQTLIAVYDLYFRNCKISPDADMQKPYARIEPDNISADVVSRDVRIYRHGAPTCCSRYTETLKFSEPLGSVSVRFVDTHDMLVQTNGENMTAPIQVEKTKMPKPIEEIPNAKYDGYIAEITLVGYPNDYQLRGVTNPRTVRGNGTIRNDKDGSVTIRAALDIPAGETETFQIIDISHRQIDDDYVIVEEFTAKGYDGEIYFFRPEVSGIDAQIDGSKVDLGILTQYALTLSMIGEHKPDNDDYVLIEKSIIITDKNGNNIPLASFEGKSSYIDHNDCWQTELFIRGRIPDMRDIKSVSVNGVEISADEFRSNEYWSEYEKTHTR